MTDDIGVTCSEFCSYIIFFMDVTGQLGRRERKKADTRAALLESARRLFDTQGFSQTTVQQITELADVSERTFFRYFQSKEDLLLPGLTSFLDSIASEFKDNPTLGDPLMALRDSVETVFVKEIARSGFMPMPLPEPWTDNLAARVAKVYLEWERRLAVIMRQRISRSHPETRDLDLVAEVVARCGVGAMRATLEVIRGYGVNRMPPPELCLRLLRRSFEVARSMSALFE